MKRTLRHAVIAAMILFGVPAHAEGPLSITVLKTSRFPHHVIPSVLVRVQNKSDQRFEWTTWSCVFFDGEQPVLEGTHMVQNVPPNGHAIGQKSYSFDGPFDRVECRFMKNKPSSCP